MPSKPLTADELREIEERTAAATPGPWLISRARGGDWMLWASLPREAEELAYFDIGRVDDAEFSAHAREDVPRLLATVRHLQWQLDVLIAAQSAKPVTITTHGAGT